MKLDRVIETCLYVDDLDRAGRFYEQVLGLSGLTRDARFRDFHLRVRGLMRAAVELAEHLG